MMELRKNSRCRKVKTNMWKDSETELDFLDFDYLIKTLRDIISDDTLLPSSIGVYGDWGSGKSSLIRMSIAELASEEGIVCLNFNGWLFEGYEDAKTALLGSILDVIKQERTLGGKAQICISQLYKSVDKLKLLKTGVKYGADFLLTGGIGSIVDMGVNGVLSKIKDKAVDLDGQKIVDVLDNESVIGAIQDELNNQELREDITKFQQKFGELLKETKIKRLVIFIDELDRCSPDTILETFEAIRLFLFVGNVAFIIGADERHITYAVKRKFEKIEGHQIDIGKEYLEKIIQYPLRIPRLNAKEVEFYITCLFFEKELTPKDFEEVIKFLKQEKREKFLDFNLNYTMLNNALPHIAEQVKGSLTISKQLASVLAEELNGNPRHCKRFLNSLAMREKMAQYTGVQLDRKVLAKLMLLEYFKGSLFKKIAKLYIETQGNTDELKHLEKGELTDTCELKLWKDDSWVERWRKIDPQLHSIDLRPYFYFSRESLEEKFDASVKKLSPAAQKIFEDLLNPASTIRTKALQAAEEVNEYEATEILNGLFGKIITQTTPSKEEYKTFLDWGITKKNLYVNVVDSLNSLSGERISLGIIPLIKGFMDQSKKEVELREIAQRWIKENPSIEKPLKKNFNI